MKNTKLGNGTKTAHLSYLGDTTIGTKSNIGGGTITANYDGVKKHRTIIGNNVGTGCNSVLIAPIAIGNNSYVAAGSTITDDVPDNSLVIARQRQVIKEGWVRKSK